MMWFMVVVLVWLLAAPASAGERLELHVPDKGASPPPPITTWWQVAEVHEDGPASSLSVTFVGDPPMRRVCAEQGEPVKATLAAMKAAGPARDAVLLRWASAMTCLGPGRVVVRP